MPQYSSFLGLDTLDGANGFKFIGQNGSGFSVSSAGDIDGDGFDDLIVGGKSDAYGGAGNAGYVIFGSGEGFAASLIPSDLNGTTGFALFMAGAADGLLVSCAGDVNGDGFDDLIVGATGYLGGASFVIFGTDAGFNPNVVIGALDGNDGFRITGETDGDLSGCSVSAAGDVNGDGIDDLIIGASGADPNGTASGASYVVFGTESGFDATLNLADLDGTNGFKIKGETGGDRSGTSVSAAGDVNGDGIDDLIVGAHVADPNGSSSGASYVVFGKAHFGAKLNLSALHGDNGFQINGEAAGDFSGFSVSNAGDVNADGIGDLIIGAMLADPNGANSGASYVVFGRDGGFDATLELSGLDGANGFQMNGNGENDRLGCSVSSAGDFNGDGFADLIVGARIITSGAYAGQTYVVFGKASGFDPVLEILSVDGNNGFRIFGEGAGDKSGNSVSGAGDVNGDGFDDLIVGAPENGDGAAYVIFGGPPGEAVTRTGTAIGNTIHGGNLADTLSGLGGPDTLVGLGGNDALLGGSGADVLVGGLGGDRLRGGGSGDRLEGDAGNDKFVFGDASESTGKSYDTIIKVDFTADRFNVGGHITDIDNTIGSGTLRSTHFDADLSGAANAGHLAIDHAVLFTPDDGNLGGKTFLIIDQNNVAGYQTGFDLVIQLSNPQNIGNLDAGDFI